jgi:hypothetical protein
VAIDGKGRGERCRHHDPLRTPFYGELHLHTSYSMDAYSSDVRGTPDDAYRFARGEPIALPPLDTAGVGTRREQLERPLDFAAVTDHASYLGPVGVCTQRTSPAYETPGCRTFRGELDGEGSLFGRMSGFLGVLRGGFPESLHRSDLSEEVCGEGGIWCTDAEISLWDATGAAAERWNGSAPSCEFSTFHAYEYTATPRLSKVHRNVVFRNASVPSRPISWIDVPFAQGLWEDLEEQCLQSGSGCDVLTIPHNSNLSNGRLFNLRYRDEPLERQRELAERRAMLEPLAEIFQIKGDSECRNGMWRVSGHDELCEFEKIRDMQGGYPDCRDGTGTGAVAGEGCQSRLDFVRYALVEGLREAKRIGVNPIKVGFVAATDSHNATPGDTEERSFRGSSGMSDPTVLARLRGSLSGRLHGLPANPGGLAGVWAEENSRDSLFDAMQRRETFGTSGTRIAPRFFGGWDFPDDLCEQADLVSRGYSEGVPMGGDLELPAASAKAPVFAVQALRDPGTQTLSGGLLQRIQIIKGWSDPDGTFHQAVYEVAGEPDNRADVDPLTCEPRGPGFDSLCGVWRDPDFEPDQYAVYYARVLENPSCRWSTWQCLSLDESARPPACGDGSVPTYVQERAWTSPIWYTPPGGPQSIASRSSANASM